MRVLTLLGLITALVFASFAIGCGNSGDSSTAALTKAEFIKRGDAICEKTDEAQKAGLKAYTEKHPKSQTTPTGVKDAVVAAGLPPIQSEAEELAELGAPNGDEAEVEAIIKGIEDALARAEKDPGSLLKTEGNPFVGVDKLADEYGFKACNNAL
jgi:hypothetical protein